METASCKISVRFACGVVGAISFHTYYSSQLGMMTDGGAFKKRYNSFSLFLLHRGGASKHDTKVVQYIVASNAHHPAAIYM